MDRGCYRCSGVAGSGIPGRDPDDPARLDFPNHEVRSLRGPPCRIVPVVLVHLIDGTFELLRYFLSPAAAFDRSAPEELRAVRGVVGSILAMLEGGVTHLGVATDHVIESFRNALWPGYKTGEGTDPLLYARTMPRDGYAGRVGVGKRRAATQSGVSGASTPSGASRQSPRRALGRRAPGSRRRRTARAGAPRRP